MTHGTGSSVSREGVRGRPTPDPAAHAADGREGDLPAAADGRGEPGAPDLPLQDPMGFRATVGAAEGGAASGISSLSAPMTVIRRGRTEQSSLPQLAHPVFSPLPRVSLNAVSVKLSSSMPVTSPFPSNVTAVGPV